MDSAVLPGTEVEARGLRWEIVATESLGNETLFRLREPGKPPFTWPVLATDAERWQVRAAIDAVVADAYGLSRDQYAHILSTFKHASYPKAPELCVATFDELKAIGLDEFTRQHEPYWDIPLNENLPQPVIELPGLAGAAGDRFNLEEPVGKGRRKGRTNH
jgi:hypothetical protein